MSSEDASEDVADKEAGRLAAPTESGGGGVEELEAATGNNGDPEILCPATDTAKKAKMRSLIERYFYQLLEGCANETCQNSNCKNSGKVPLLTPNQAAAKAVELFFQGATLCQNTHPSSVPPPPPPTSLPPTTPCDKSAPQQTKSSCSLVSGDASSSSEASSTSTTTADKGNCDKSPTSTDQKEEQQQHSSGTEERPRRSYRGDEEGSRGRTSETIDETFILDALKDSLTNTSALDGLVQRIGAAFSSIDGIAGSFGRKERAPLDHVLDKASQLQFSEGKGLTKEQLRTLEEDQDKDEDSCAEKEEPVPEWHNTEVDLASLRRSFRLLFGLPDTSMRDRCLTTLNSVLCKLVEPLPFKLQCTLSRKQEENILISCIVILELFCLAPRDFMDVLLISVCETLDSMPTWAQARIAWIYAVHCQESIRSLLEILHDLISCQVESMTEFDGEDKIEDNEIVLHAVKTMKLLYYANILAGEYEETPTREEDAEAPRFLGLEFDDDADLDGSFMGVSAAVSGGDAESGRSLFTSDPLAEELGVSVMDSRKPLIPFAEFVNEVLSEALEMDQDYLNFYNARTRRADEPGYTRTSFMVYPFVLTTMKKTLAMYFHSRIRMYSEGRISILHNHFSGQPINPYLKLKVRRDHLIEDALIELEMLAMTNPTDLKKQLVVEFVGEQGVDEGGVSKEFFQLIVEQIFNPEYGMFVHHEQSEMFWINSTSFENDAQFSLIGIVLGLAIYNNIILAVNFPMVIYRKLMGMKGCFADLCDWNPELHQSLSKMLQDEDSDMEDVYMQSFEISYKDVYGEVVTQELKEDGKTLMVTQENKREFVNLYADFLLNKSIEKQFRAFRKGFQMVMAESPLNLLFRPEEVELLVCGSKQFDVTQLQKATEYDHGYTAESQIIKDFWDIVNEMPIELQRKLLEFSTGSDRVPVGGLSNLKLMIARHGPDSDRLPTSHTCYNILLLPEYSSKEKLKDRLLKAISFSKGFGML